MLWLVPGVWHGLMNGLERYLVYGLGLWMVLERCPEYDLGLWSVPGVRNGNMAVLERYLVYEMGLWMV
jgi:hypothetical protein